MRAGAGASRAGKKREGEIPVVLSREESWRDLEKAAQKEDARSFGLLRVVVTLFLFSLPLCSFCCCSFSIYLTTAST
jgi:hypothetical protein